MNLLWNIHSDAISLFSVNSEMQQMKKKFDKEIKDIAAAGKC